MKCLLQFCKPRHLYLSNYGLLRLGNITSICKREKIHSTTIENSLLLFVKIKIWNIEIYALLIFNKRKNIRCVKPVKGSSASREVKL